MNRRPKQTAATRKNIMKAFMEISKEKGVRKVTIREITEKAGINRSTFYQYFADVYDLLDKYENDLLEQAEKVFEENLAAAGVPETMADFSKIASEIFRQFGSEVFFLLGENGDPVFRKKLSGFMLLVMEKSLFRNIDMKDIKNLDYMMAFAMSGISGVMLHWHEKDESINEEDMLILIETLLTKGFEGYLNIKIF